MGQLQWLDGHDPTCIAKFAKSRPGLPDVSADIHNEVYSMPRQQHGELAVIGFPQRPLKEQFPKPHREMTTYSSQAFNYWAALGESYPRIPRSEEHTSELPSLMHIPYHVFAIQKKK